MNPVYGTTEVSTPEDEILIACSRLGRADRDRIIATCRQHTVDWQLVYFSSVAHKVTPLVYRNLFECGLFDDRIPADVARRFRIALANDVLRKRFVENQIPRIVSFFDGRSHDTLLLKQGALRVCMPQLYEVTMFDDIDVVVRPRSEPLERIGELYSWPAASRWDPTWDVIDQFVLDKNNNAMMFEIDNRVHHDVVWNGVLSIDFRSVWEDADRVEIDGNAVYVPHLHDRIIMCSVNVFRKPHLRLRNIVEIHELCRDQSHLDWDSLSRKAHSYHCNTLLYAALHATRAMLGTELEEANLRTLGLGTLRRKAMSLVNRTASPCSVCLPSSRSDHPGLPRRTLKDVLRRVLALNARQLARYIVFRIIVQRGRLAFRRTTDVLFRFSRKPA
jgi:hypothetical protein